MNMEVTPVPDPQAQSAAANTYVETWRLPKPMLQIATTGLSHEIPIAGEKSPMGSVWHSACGAKYHAPFTYMFFFHVDYFLWYLFYDYQSHHIETSLFSFSKPSLSLLEYISTVPSVSVSSGHTSFISFAKAA